MNILVKSSNLPNMVLRELLFDDKYFVCKGNDINDVLLSIFVKLRKSNKLVFIMTRMLSPKYLISLCQLVVLKAAAIVKACSLRTNEIENVFLIFSCLCLDIH